MLQCVRLQLRLDIACMEQPLDFFQIYFFSFNGKAYVGDTTFNLLNVFSRILDVVKINITLSNKNVIIRINITIPQYSLQPEMLILVEYNFQRSHKNLRRIGVPSAVTKKIYILYL